MQMKAHPPGMRATSPASIPKDADGRGDRSTSQIPDDVTPEEPPLQAGTPAFQSVYDVLFKNEPGIEAESQITALEDTWHWNASAEGTRTLLSAKPNAEASDIGSSTTPNDADKSVRVPTYRIIGEPEDLDGARQLATEDRYQFAPRSKGNCSCLPKFSFRKPP
jgi:hypothetical protein